MKKRNRQSGIALMIVLSAITLLTSIATEFAYNCNVNYNLALNEKERVQAMLLAESALSLMKLELKLEKEIRAKVASTPAANALGAGLSGPLCQQMPLSTGLIRSMFLGEVPEGPGGEEGEEEAGGDEGSEEGTGSPAAFISGLQVDAAEEFLDFEGDFEGECFDESSKFNLNMFFKKNPQDKVMSGVNSYDKAKQLLINVLKRPEYKNLFPDENGKDIEDIVRNIADWIDADDRMNESGGVSTGNEESLYTAGVTGYNVKNGKFLTLDELYMVAGVEDAWFLPIKNNFTVYGDDKVNVCIAGDEIVAALIVQYANSNQNVPKINPTDKEKIAKLVDVVKNGCTGVKPDVNAIAQALDTALGVQSSTAPQTTQPTQTTETEQGATTTTTSGGSGFASMITAESRYYVLYGSGFVGDTTVRITAVLDTKEAQPARWRYVYWKME